MSIRAFGVYALFYLLKVFLIIPTIETIVSIELMHRWVELYVSRNEF